MNERAAAPDVQAKVLRVRNAIESACERSGRRASEITLIGASKYVPADRIRQALEAGVLDFGENYVKELAEKKSLVPEANWHYLGALQSGTAARVADVADVVHSVGPGRAAQRLSQRAASRGRRLRALIQVDFADRETGCRPQDVRAFAADAATLSGLEIVGLMTLPPVPGRADDAESARPWFRKLREMRDDLRESFPGLRELSMGMSLDYGVAVEEGATMVRVGTALFGERPRAQAQP